MKLRHLVPLFAVVLLLACSNRTPANAGGGATPEPEEPALPPDPQTAYFAGGCFWCMEGPFEALDGVDEVVSGYTGGTERNPSYGEVSAGLTGHTEAVRVEYDANVVSYEELLHVFWRSMDPTDAEGQFADRGSQYRPGIFVRNDEERAMAEASKAALDESGPFDSPIIVPIEDVGEFWDAEDYHQNYYLTNTEYYESYRRGSGRERFLERHWGDAH